MDPIKILKRAWQILWNYRALWVFGVILALTVGGARGGSNGGGGDHSDGSPSFPGPTRQPGPMPHSIPEAVDQFQKWLDQGLPPLNLTPQDVSLLIGIIIAMVIGAILFGIIATIFRYVAETALIRMVDEHERSGEKPGVRQGFRWGWSRTAWRLFLIDVLVIGLPVLAFISLVMLLGVGVYLAITNGGQIIGTAGTVAGVGIAFLLLFVGILVGIALWLLRNFFWRACALENLGVVEAIRRGYGQVRRNWKSVGLMWLIMVGLGIAWSIAMIFVIFLSLPVLVFSGLAGIVISAIPGLLALGISNLFIASPWTWIITALVAAPLFLLVFASPLIFVRGLEMTFVSSVWTLTYREINVLEASSLQGAELPPTVEAA